MLRSIVRGLGLALGLSAAATAPALAAYPDKPVKIVVNFTAGGPLDIMARLIADRLNATFKQPFIVENRTGSGGNIGAAAVANAAPDGYTVLFGLDSTFTVNPSLYSSLGFRLDQLKPVVRLASSGMLIAAHPSAKADTLKGLVDQGLRDAVTFSSAGNGSPGHLSLSMLSQATDMKINHIPYRGNAPAVLALVSGEVQAAALATPGLLQHVNAGTIKALAVTGSQRSPLLPSVPTTAELGYPAVKQDVLYVAMVPSGTPDGIVRTLQSAIGKILAQPDVQQRLRAMDFTLESLDGEAAAKELAAVRERYAKIIKSAGMTVD
ncbi:MAG: tripartite tricarboxylate transporter substrate binding protein [Pigmentiphaga sp.]|uniref:Bug family tripartite tricarboxylate transporter substrate binding protein n=1 Tax=Pigmentiphaga sp. TaxID=1977564 RepID=UPI0029B63361|nr:tripartite tricarboxylate transporter substrate binding protein [Pigmentiphaga sp.]MDX3905532.1 tripartite tricarboxylate transporter substrate binding protein [Pigmentiphaga sp.]